VKNARRVLLTKTHQGMVIFVPQGEAEDAMRLPEYLDGTFAYLVCCGFDVLRKLKWNAQIPYAAWQDFGLQAALELGDGFPSFQML
jgi:hypothetical protein